jgi:hypothetical protein
MMETVLSTLVRYFLAVEEPIFSTAFNLGPLVRYFLAVLVRYVLEEPIFSTAFNLGPTSPK